ncbi:hypothetical protein HMPREF0880_00180 [Yokenella regensburgei ATCC 43003]|nr:hypothetical protein HMPREF0880_00180 [Yokenella regensburgei ATCC 43003]
MLLFCALTITFAHPLAIYSSLKAKFGKMVQTSVENGQLKAR